MRPVALALLTVLGAACGEAALKAAGEPCVGSAECGPGLVCDLALDQPVCAEQGSGGGGPADAAPPTPDADPAAPDAAPGTPDAAPGTPDAGLPDAGLPDAGLPDAAV